MFVLFYKYLLPIPFNPLHNPENSCICEVELSRYLADAEALLVKLGDAVFINFSCLLGVAGQVGVFVIVAGKLELQKFIVLYNIA